MFAYTEKYTESESDIQNNDLLYTTHQKHQNAFEKLEKCGNIKKNKKTILFYTKIQNFTKFRK